MARFFIDRPVFAWVISILIMDGSTDSGLLASMRTEPSLVNLMALSTRLFTMR